MNPLPSYGQSHSTPRLPIVTAIARLAAHASFELTGCELPALERARDAIPPRTMVSITWLPKETHDDRVAAARAVHAAGFEPVPHVAARCIRTCEEAGELIRRLCGEAGVRRILLIGGDTSQPAGEFASALELLARFRNDRRGLRQVGFAAYPDGHPRLASRRLEADLDTKLAVAEDAGLEPFVITQFAFDARPIIQWLEAFRARGHDVPVRIGLAGPATIRTLMRFARICGIGASTRALIANGASLARMVHETGPDPVILQLAEAKIGERLGPVGLHLFPFGGLDRAAAWISPVGQGHIRLRRNESGFEPDP